MKKTKLITGIVCGIIALALCIAVCVIWHRQGCGFWSLFAGCVFYCIGSYGLYIFVMDVIDWVQYWFGNGNEYYKGRKH